MFTLGINVRLYKNSIINGRNVQRKNVVNNVDKSGLIMGTMTKWPVQKHTAHHKTGSIQKTQQTRNNYFLSFSDFYV